MHTFKWEPKTVELESEEEGGEIEKVKPSFSGYCIVEAPPFAKRMEYMKQTLLQDDGVEIKEADTEKAYNQLSEMSALAEIAKTHIQEVKLKRVSDGMIFDSVDMLECDNFGGLLLAQIGKQVREGVRLGKNSERKSEEK